MDTLLMLVGVGLLAVTLSTSEISGTPDQEKVNKEFVQKKVEICKESGCKECGYFYEMLGGQVGYFETLCESDWRRKHDDQEIRKKYAP